MGIPKYKNLNIKIRLKSDNTVEFEQFSEEKPTITVTNDGDDKILVIQGKIEEIREYGELF
jgi:hypothetical protein